jgi:protein-disulfide isomerase
MKKLLPFLLILVVLGGAVGAGAWYMKRSSAPTASAVAGVAGVAGGAGGAAPSASVPTGPIEPGAQPPHAEGELGAPATLEEFGDFQCPPCGLLHPVLKQMQREFGPKLRIIFREFPLVPTHEHALAAARAAEAAGLQGKFWPMHDMIYDNQKAWKDLFDVRPAFEAYATKIGLDLDRFRSDLNGSAVQDRITEDGKRARSLNVKGTPTVFLNDVEVPYESLTPEKLRGVIQKELGSK